MLLRDRLLCEAFERHGHRILPGLIYLQQVKMFCD